MTLGFCVSAVMCFSQSDAGGVGFFLALTFLGS
jgi:hypothetical protein